MVPKDSVIRNSSPLFSVRYLFLTIALCALSFFIFLQLNTEKASFSTVRSRRSSVISLHRKDHINVYVAELPRRLNYGLIEEYWSLKGDSRLKIDEENEIRSSIGKKSVEFPPYPENPLIKQYSAEYWITGDLMTPENLRYNSFAIRVSKPEDADVVFVPFFATLSAEMQLGSAKGLFRKKSGNEDYARQREVVDYVKGTDAWKRSGGRDHVFVLTDPVAMWHVRSEIAAAVLLVVDFGGWFRMEKNASSSVIQHNQVSLLKDVIIPYTHLLPRLEPANNKKRSNLVYFKGAKHRHRGGMIREKLWKLLSNETGVVMEEGFPDAERRNQSMRGMRDSDFCLHPAGDTPTSCRLFDAIQSLCIPVIISDEIELPFEGMIDYSSFSVFVSVSDALQSNWLVRHLRSFSGDLKEEFRRRMATLQSVFVYDNGAPGGIGPVVRDGAVNQIWRKVHQKLPTINEAIVRDRRKPPGASMAARCQCM